jgi:hypothetical protein
MMLMAISRKMTSMMVLQRNLGGDSNPLSAVTGKTDIGQPMLF